jgi:hypothetical protein
MTERKKRGRPPLPAEVKLTRELTRLLTRTNAFLDAMLEGRELPNPKGGRPPNWDNQLLLELANDLQRGGMSLRAFAKKYIALDKGRAAEPEEVSRCERQINRLRQKKMREVEVAPQY